ncbi:MAG TPA: hypothetical protein VLM89_13065 [Phycisphaerae bacterium]|nr:hypothetical protein [Phycisphaerae bacterium]
MKRVRIEVVRGRAYCSTDGFQVHGDRGTGMMDRDHPLTPRRILFWDDVPAMAGHLLGGHAAAQHLDGRMPDRHGEETWLLDEHLWPAGTVAWESEPHVFGRFRYAVAIEDAAGNRAVEGAPVEEVVVHSEPAPPSELVPQSYDALTGRLTLRFRPSLKLAG